MKTKNIFRNYKINNWFDDLSEELKLHGIQYGKTMETLLGLCDVEDNQNFIHQFLTFYNGLSVQFKESFTHVYSNSMIVKILYIEWCLSNTIQTKNIKEPKYPIDHSDFIDQWYGMTESNTTIEESLYLSNIYQVEYEYRIKTHRICKH